MPRYLITGSSDGVGLAAATRLVQEGNEVILHARNAQRAEDAQSSCPGAAGVVIGDLSTLDGVTAFAAEADKMGPYDAIMHNAGVFTASRSLIWQVNVVAPYALSCLMARPKRALVFVSSGLHNGAGRLGPKLQREDLDQCDYSESKAYDIMLAKAFARRWGDVMSVNVVNPGWVPTKLGGAGAPERVEDAVETYLMAMEMRGSGEGINGAYFARGKRDKPSAQTEDVDLQEKLIARLEQVTGIKAPDRPREEVQ